MKTNTMNAIFAHAQYELNILLRSWFFRIFAILSLLIITGLNLVFFTTLVPTPWLFKGISSFPAYVTSILLNQWQSALIIFLATDVYKRDLKMDSSEVIQIRSMTNLSYIWGKTLGILFVFGLLDFVILFISAIIHLAGGAVSISLISYILYPLMILLPSMVFATGLSFLFMRYLKNQAVSILLMLGIMGISLFFLIDKADGLYDYIGLVVPLAYSEFVGLTSWTVVAAQRGLYLFLGISSLLWISYSYQRLEQSQILKKALAFLAVFSLIIAGTMTVFFIQHYNTGRQTRIDFNRINKEWQDAIPLVTEKCTINLNHSGETFAANAELKLKNTTGQSQDKYLLSLNPGLEVQRIRIEQKQQDFERDLHLIIVKPDNPLLSGDSVSISIDYSGTIDENICFSGVTEEIRGDPYQVFIAKVDKKYAFLENDYLLLPPNSLWYPVSGLPLGSVFPKQNNINFIDFSLNVETAEELSVFSQGVRTTGEDGIVHFAPEMPLPFISLIAGRYEEQTIRIDSIDYTLATYPGHDYYIEYFDQIGDTLEYLIRELKQDYERNLELEYPFNRLTIVETPIQYITYKQTWTTSSAFIMPEQIWLPENAVNIENADFARRFRRQDRIASDYTLTDVEKQNNVLKDFFRDTFLSGGAGRGRFRSEERPNYNIFPNYYTYLNYFPSAKYGLLNSALESFLLARTAGESSSFSSFRSGLTIEEQVCQALDGKSLNQVLAVDSQAYLISDILKVKGDYLLSQFQFYSGEAEFYKNTMDFIVDNRFKSTPLEQLFAIWNAESTFDVDRLIKKWLTDTEIPKVMIKNLELYKVYDKDRIRYQVKFKASNSSQNDALIKVSFRFGGRRQSILGNEVEEEAPKTILIKSNRAKEVGIILDAEPNRLTINSLLAKNIPLLFTKRFEKTELNEKALPFDGEIEFDKPFRMTNEGEIVIDNESPTFSILDTMKVNFLQKLTGMAQQDRKDAFVRFQFWRPPDYWRRVKNPGFYGDYIHSAFYISSGSNNRRVEWQAAIVDAGYYEVYAHVVNHQSIQSRRFEKEWLREHKYTVFHDDGEDPFSIDVQNADEGWNYLGRFYFSEGMARIQLSNKSQGRFVIADAVKWVKR